MKTTIKNLPKSQKEIEVEISVEEMKNYVEQATKKLSQEIKIDGFRPGKVPLEIVKQKIGELGIYQEAGDLAIKKTYLQAIEENKLEVIGQPKIEIIKIAPDNPLEYKIVLTILPEVKLCDYTKIKGKLEKKEVEDKKVDGELEKIQKTRAKFITIQEPAQKGDRVEIDFESRLGGVKIDGGESKNHPLVIGESLFVPGFEDNLIGLKENEEKKFSVIFPKEYYKKELAGKNIDFKVKMKLVQKIELPELNGEFAKSLGKFKDLENLKSSIREGMEAEAKNKARDELREKIIDQIIAGSEMEIPDLLIESELDLMLRELEHNIIQSGIEFEKYLENLKTSRESLRQGWRKDAERRVKLNLIMREINKKEEIKIEAEALKEKVDQILKAYSGKEEAEKNIDVQRLREHLEEAMVKDEIFKMLEKIATNNS